MRWPNVVGVLLLILGVTGCAPFGRGLEGPCTNGVVVPTRVDNPGTI